MIAICRNQLGCPSKLRSTVFNEVDALGFAFSKPIHINANEEIAIAGSKSVKATVQKQHLQNKKIYISNIGVVVVLLFITGWVG